MMEKMATRKIAFLISRLFDPFFETPLFLFFLIAKSGLPPQRQLILTAVILFEFVLLFGYFLLARRRKEISDWDISDVRQRRRLYLLTSVCLLSLLVFFRIFGNPFLFNLGLILCFLTLAVTAITFFWKISVHAVANTTFILYLNFLFGWQYFWLFLILPPLLWARFVLKKHTPKQLLAGVLLPTVVVLSFFLVLGYL